MNTLHVLGIFLRNVYLLKRSFPRLFGLFMWITIELAFWGFITLWLEDVAREDVVFNFVLILLSAVIFWDLFIRAQQSFTISFLEEIWARNVMNLFTTPTTKREIVAGFIVLSIFQGLLSFLYVAVLAFILYALEIWQLGFYIIPFFINILVFGWALGLVTIGLMIRFGPSTEILAWFIPFLILPLSAVYHPVSVFPDSIRQVAQFLPTMHLFEGMRQVLTLGVFPLDHMLWAAGLTAVYFIGGIAFFVWMIRIAREKGLIARLLA